jgi:ankyrin repeat protein
LNCHILLFFHLVATKPCSFLFLFFENIRQVATWKVDGNLPIHIACSFRSPFPLISVVIEAYTQGASVPNDSGDLPIHCVLCPVREAGLLTVVDLLKVVALLLRHHPNGAKQKNNHGNVAVHCATAHDAPMDVIKLLLKAYPEGAHQKNNNSKTPLDLAVENGASPEVVAFLQGKGIPSSEEESSSDDVKAVAALHEWIAGKEGWEVAIIRAECKRYNPLSY